MTFAAGSTWAAALRTLTPAHPGPDPILVLPASLRRADPLAGAVRAHLRDTGNASHLLLPVNPAAALLGRPAGGWRDVVLPVPDGPPTPATLPARLLGPDPVWTVTDVDAVRGAGPWVLDLVARYLHPRSRLRQLASPRRADAVVDVNLVARPAACVIGTSVGPTALVAITRDPIAAELVALALADEELDPKRTTTGPWEDRVVQRATELQLGIQIPAHLTFHLAGTPDPAVERVLQRVADRIGVRIA
jgi:hypothetical protein